MSIFDDLFDEVDNQLMEIDVTDNDDECSIGFPEAGVSALFDEDGCFSGLSEYEE